MKYLARREFGKAARVYQIDGPEHPSWKPTAWAFTAPKVGGPGCAAFGWTPQLALTALHSVEDDAALDMTDREADRRFKNYVSGKRSP